MVTIVASDRSKTRTPPANEARNRAHVIVAKSLNKAGNRDMKKGRSRKLHKARPRLDINSRLMIKSAKSTLNVSSETPPVKSMSLSGNTSAQERKQVRRQIQTGISTRNQIKKGHMNVGSRSPISDIRLLKLNQDVNKCISDGERRSGKRNHNISRKLIMPAKLLTGIFGQKKPTALQQLEAKSTEEIDSLR